MKPAAQLIAEGRAADEITSAPLARTVCGEHIVLYRTTA
jgi:hypothetical protein